MHTSKFSSCAVSQKPSRKLFDSSRQNLHLVQQMPQGQQPAMSNGHTMWKTETPSICRVLQVEDNAENRFIVHSYLKRDYAYESVEHGEHALDMLEEQDFDIIVMDLNLGAGINGIETARRIRAHKKHEQTAIIAVTANVSPQIKQQCFQAGMDGFLPKPFRKEDLMQAMDTAIKNKNGQS